MKIRKMQSETQKYMYSYLETAGSYLEFTSFNFRFGDRQS